MPKIVTPIIAVVEMIGKAKESTFNEGGFYHSVLFLDESLSGDEAKIWKSMFPDEVEQLRKGDRVQLIPAGLDKNGKEKHQIVKLSGLPSGTTQSTATKPRGDRPPSEVSYTGMSDETRLATATYIGQMGRLYAFCLKTAKQELGDEDSETIRCMASALFIAADRRFKF